MLFRVLIIAVLFHIVKCSIVVDIPKQIRLLDYCPKTEYCAEGAHVMCMYNNYVKGPLCGNSPNISMTPEIAERLLALSNVFRARISRGKETGKNGEKLPRGYGVFKLRWDQELATFAQVLANQCYMEHDKCKATSKFHDPGQNIGMVRFSFPDWIPKDTSDKKLTQRGINPEKTMHAAIHAQKAVYSGKKDVTSGMINNFPGFDEGSHNSQLYLQMVYGPSTHMGCGISAFTEHSTGKLEARIVHNAMITVCNFSAKPQKNKPVYNTLPPSDRDIPFSRCGCPVGSEADEDCLCSETMQIKDEIKRKLTRCNGTVCEPTVVLLPIVTVEDAPKEKLIHLDRYSNTSLRRSDDFNMDLFEKNHNTRKYMNQAKEVKEHYTPNNQINEIKNFESNRRALTQPKLQVKKRYFDKKKIESKPNRKSARTVPKHVRPKKISIFARATTFMLPNTKSKSQQSTTNSIKKDVVIRRDFTSAKKLANTYVHDKQALLKEIENIKAHTDNPHPIQNAEPIHSTIYDVTPTTTYKYENNFSNTTTVEPIDGLVQTDNKLLHLLDTLEHEVKNVELRGPDKEIFDAKIRKIYGKIVGQSSLSSLKLKLKIPQLTNDIDIKEIVEKHINELEDEVKKTSKPHETSLENDHNIHAKENTIDDTTHDKSPYLSHGLDVNSYDNSRNARRHSKTFNSFENKHDYSHTEYQFKNKRPYKNEKFEPKYREVNDLERRDKRHRNHINNNERGIEEPLSVERRKFYQDKLDNIERRLNRVRNHKRRRVPNGRHMRAMVPSERKSENQMDPFYMPDRARILHGY